MNMMAQTTRTGNTSPRPDTFAKVPREIVAATGEDRVESLLGRRTGERVDGAVVLAGFRRCTIGERRYGSDPERVHDTHGGAIRVRSGERKYFHELDRLSVAI
jgi:hypothetical protein